MTPATIYPTSRVIDSWGVLELTDGVLIVRESGKFARVVVQAPPSSVPAGSPLKGNGWQLELASVWRIVPATQTGDLIVRKSD